MMQNCSESVPVLIAAAGERGRAALAGFLPETEFSVMASVGTAEAVRRAELPSAQPVLAVINMPLPDESGVSLSMELASDRRFCGILLLSPAEDSEKTQAALRSYERIVILKKPAARSLIRSTALLLAASEEDRRTDTVSSDSAAGQEKEANRRVIARAKLLLIRHMQLTEEQAHRYIEKNAMDLCMKQRDVAEMLIRTYENFG